MGKFSRFIGDVARDTVQAMAKDALAQRAFGAAQNAAPPPQYADPDVQALSDEAYRQGQLSVAVKVGNRIADQD